MAPDPLRNHRSRTSHGDHRWFGAQLSDGADARRPSEQRASPAHRRSTGQRGRHAHSWTENNGWRWGRRGSTTASVARRLVARISGTSGCRSSSGGRCDRAASPRGSASCCMRWRGEPLLHQRAAGQQAQKSCAMPSLVEPPIRTGSSSRRTRRESACRLHDGPCRAAAKSRLAAIAAAYSSG